MKPPRPIFLSKKPFTIKCPACSMTFNIADYSASSGHERAGEVDRAYEMHFKEVHSKEDASQAAMRIVREATEQD